METEQLFLLEVLVKSIKLSEQNKINLPSDQLKTNQLCVRVKFLDFPCIEICQEDFLGEEEIGCSALTTPNKLGTKFSEKAQNELLKHEDNKEIGERKSDRSVKSDKPLKVDKGGKVLGKKISKVNESSSFKSTTKQEDSVKEQISSLHQLDFSSGKSCLFPMVPLELVWELQRHPIAMHVFRKIQESQMTVIGQCKLQLGTEFRDAILKSVYDNEPLPVTSILDCKNKLANIFGDEMGEINTFVRLSCFGSTIVTKFQLRGQEHQDYIFRTSKKDNTCEAQKKKRSLYTRGPFEKPKVVKKLANRHDVSPLSPIITTEENCFDFNTNENQRFGPPIKYEPPKDFFVKRNCDENSSLLSPGNEKGKTEIGLQHYYVSNRQNYNYRPTGHKDEEKQSHQPVQGKRKSSCCFGPDNLDPAVQNKKQKSFQSDFITSIINDDINNVQRNYCPILDCSCCNNGSQLSKAAGTDIVSTKVSPNIPDKSIKKYIKQNCEQIRDCQHYRQINDAEKTKKEIEQCYFAEIHLRNDPGRCKLGIDSKGDLFCCNDMSTCAGKTGLDESYCPCGTNRVTNNYLRNQSRSEKYNTYDGKLIKPACNEFMKGKHGDKDSTDPRNRAGSRQKSKERGSVLALEPKKPSIDKELLGQQVVGTVESTSDKKLVEKKQEPLEKRKEINEKGLESVDSKPELEKKKENEYQKTTGSIHSDQLPYSKMRHKGKAENTHHHLTDAKGGGDSLPNTEIAKMKRKKLYRSIYRYTAGMYPGINIGHRYCTKEFRFVPKTMGWLWNIGDIGDGLRARRGWKPGAINRKIASMIRSGKKAAGLALDEEQGTLQPKSAKSGKRTKRINKPQGSHSSSSQGGEYNAGSQSPTLHVHKKDGAYFIAMNPLKAESEDEDEEHAPLMFKILPHDEEVSTSSESSLEIEFTAPGAYRKKPIKRIMETVDTQCSDGESEGEISPNSKDKKPTELNTKIDSEVIPQVAEKLKK